MNLYHYTDGTHIPFIILDEYVKPGDGMVGDFPKPEFLWATSSSLIDKTATIMSESALKAYRLGNPRIRLTLNREDFTPWADVSTDFPAWIPEEKQRLERCMPNETEPDNWFIRDKPLHTHEIAMIEMQTYTNKTWRPLGEVGLDRLDEEIILVTWSESNIWRYQQAPGLGSHGQMSYRVKKL